MDECGRGEYGETRESGGGGSEEKLHQLRQLIWEPPPLDTIDRCQNKPGRGTQQLVPGCGTNQPLADLK